MKQELKKLIELCISQQGNQAGLQKLDTILNSIVDSYSTSFADCEKLESRLYKLRYNNINYELGKKFMKERYVPSGCKCTVVQSNNIIGRNLDETYNDSITAFIEVAPSDNTYQSWGLISGMPLLTRELLESGDNSEILEVAPFFTVDAINSEGLFVEVNLLNREISKGTTTGTTPAIEQREELSMMMLPRYIVDHYASVDDAITDITNYIKVYAPDTERFSGEFHYYLADGTKSVILEFVNNEIAVTEVGTDYPTVMTNFYVDGVTLNDDNTITRNTSDDPDAENENGVTPYGSGIERHNLVISQLSGIQSVEDMQDLMRSLFYTKSYTLTENKWYTEFVGGQLTVTSPDSAFSEIMQKASEIYAERSRENPVTWQTIHSAVYDLANKVIYVCVQEGETYHKFTFGPASVEEQIGSLAELETDHKSSLVAAINELADVLGTTELVVNMAQSQAERKVIYDLCKLHPQLAKNIVFYVPDDGLYYGVNGYNFENELLTLHVIMKDSGTGLRHSTFQIASNGSIAVI